MNVLLGCEESQEVCKAFRAKGHNAFSCDFQDCSGGHPEWHLKMDVFIAIACGMLVTQSGELITIDKWDMGIFHPVCRFLTVSNNNALSNGLAPLSSINSIIDLLILKVT